MTDPSRITRDELGLALAATWARRGTCGRRQVGCVLLDKDSWPVGSGYNGPPSGEAHCSSATPCPGFGARSGTDLDLCESVHAEINALSRCRDVREIYTCYVTVSPCASCVKALMNTGCRRIMFAEEYASEHAVLARGRWEKAGREWLNVPSLSAHSTTLKPMQAVCDMRNLATVRCIEVDAAGVVVTRKKCACAISACRVAQYVVEHLV